MTPHDRPIARPLRRTGARLASGRRDVGRVLTLMAKAAMYRPGAVPERPASHGGGRELDVLLDRSGSANGDDRAAERANRRAAHPGARETSGTRIVELPKAFGPFEQPDVREATSRILRIRALTVARDADGLDLLRTPDRPPDAPRFARMPDITRLLEAGAPQDVGAWRDRDAIVLDARRMDQSSGARRTARRPSST